MKDRQFNVGDWVICRKFYEDKSCSGLGYNEGYSFKIYSIKFGKDTNHPILGYCYFPEKGAGVFEECLEKLPDFEVGTEVSLINHRYYPDGICGTIQDVYEDFRPKRYLVNLTNVIIDSINEDNLIPLAKPETIKIDFQKLKQRI